MSRRIPQKSLRPSHITTTTAAAASGSEPQSCMFTEDCLSDVTKCMGGICKKEPTKAYQVGFWLFFSTIGMCLLVAIFLIYKVRKRRQRTTIVNLVDQNNKHKASPSIATEAAAIINRADKEALDLAFTTERDKNPYKLQDDQQQ